MSFQSHSFYVSLLLYQPPLIYIFSSCSMQRVLHSDKIHRLDRKFILKVVWFYWVVVLYSFWYAVLTEEVLALTDSVLRTNFQSEVVEFIVIYWLSYHCKDFFAHMMWLIFVLIPCRMGKQSRSYWLTWGPVETKVDTLGTTGMMTGRRSADSDSHRS